MLDLLVKVTCVLVVALAAILCLRRASAALLHLLCLAAILAVLILPAARFTTPVTLNSTLVVASPVEIVSAAPGQASISARTVLLSMWVVGCLLVLFRLCAGVAKLRSITRRASRASTSLCTAHVAVYLSPDISIPLTWGCLRPVILLPQSATGWTPTRLRNAIAHEEAHVDRMDWLAQMLARAACALYWFHPLMWLTSAVLRNYGERACDDRVLSSGVAATEYASDLVEIARLSRRTPPEALAIASRSLEQRLHAVLESRRSRWAPGRGPSAVLLIALAAAVLPLAPLHLAAYPEGGKLIGSVRDASGAMIPGVTVGAENLDGNNQEAALTDDVGRFQFTGLPPGRYRITLQSPGFKVFHSGPILVEGGEAQLDAVLDVGGVFEQVQVVGQRTHPAEQSAAPARIRIGGNVQATKLLTKVDPVYPARALDAGVEGTVLLQAVIGLDGVPLSLNALSKSSDPDLVTAALDAVRQWRYQPVLLNGVPVEVVTTIAVTFRLKQ